MATNTQWATSLLDEAAAIVEAEWIRLQQDQALWEREVADLFSELPAGPARPASASPLPSAGAPANRCQRTVAGGRRGDRPQPRYGLPSGLLRRLGKPTERHCRTREVMPSPMITTRQRLLCRPQ